MARHALAIRPDPRPVRGDAAGVAGHRPEPPAAGDRRPGVRGARATLGLAAAGRGDAARERRRRDRHPARRRATRRGAHPRAARGAAHAAAAAVVRPRRPAARRSRAGTLPRQPRRRRLPARGRSAAGVARVRRTAGAALARPRALCRDAGSRVRLRDPGCVALPRLRDPRHRRGRAVRPVRARTRRRRPAARAATRRGRRRRERAGDRVLVVRRADPFARRRTATHQRPHRQPDRRVRQGGARHDGGLRALPRPQVRRDPGGRLLRVGRVPAQLALRAAAAVPARPAQRRVPGSHRRPACLHRGVDRGGRRRAGGADGGADPARRRHAAGPRGHDGGDPRQRRLRRRSLARSVVPRSRRDTVHAAAPARGVVAQRHRRHRARWRARPADLHGREALPARARRRSRLPRAGRRRRPQPAARPDLRRSAPRHRRPAAALDHLRPAFVARQRGLRAGPRPAHTRTGRLDARHRRVSGRRVARAAGRGRE